MKTIAPLLLMMVFAASCKSYNPMVKQSTIGIAPMLDAWHLAAAEARYDDYFQMMSDDAVFIGTDPTENWPLDAFKEFAKPYFDRGKTWNFKALDRHIYLSADGNMAWFDELLDTQMKLCRGSGVLKKIDGQWKIAHYVLSMTIPNDHTDKVITIKADFDDTLKKKLLGE